MATDRPYADGLGPPGEGDSGADAGDGDGDGNGNGAGDGDGGVGEQSGDGEFKTVGEFAAAYDVDPALLPWRHRRFDLLAVGQLLATFINDLRPTRQMFNADDVAAASDVLSSAQAAAHIPLELFLLHQAWPVPTDAQQRRFANPGYAHLHVPSAMPRLRATDARREWLERYGRLGVVPATTIAAHFGLDADDAAAAREAVQTVARALDVSWSALRAAGRSHMGRVLAIALRWTDATRAEVATAYGLSSDRVRELVKRVRDQGFRAPPQPTQVRRSDVPPRS